MNSNRDGLAKPFRFRPLNQNRRWNDFHLPLRNQNEHERRWNRSILFHIMSVASTSIFVSYVTCWELKYCECDELLLFNYVESLKILWNYSRARWWSGQTCLYRIKSVLRAVFDCYVGIEKGFWVFEKLLEAWQKVINTVKPIMFIARGFFTLVCHIFNSFLTRIFSFTLTFKTFVTWLNTLPIQNRHQRVFVVYNYNCHWIKVSFGFDNNLDSSWSSLMYL